MPDMSYGSMTEEDLRARVLLPFLKCLGIGPDQIELEKSFRVRLGRTVACLQSIGGRLDVLVRSSTGGNLFVVELKREDCELTDEDRDQGISYARLLDQIAPFVLVTNGRESRLFDAVSKERLDNQKFPNQSSFWRNGGVLATTEDVRIRYEALKHFLGYSVANVGEFSKRQQEERMKALRGSLTQRDRKYIPETYVPRRKTQEAVGRFLAGAGSVLAIVGESGVGKTNEMCALAERLSDTHVAIFFSAGSMASGLGDALADEFNWHFSDQLRAPELVKRLAEIAGVTQKSMVILVDAIDEAVKPGFEQSVSDLASQLVAFSGKIRLIVSAKATEWDRFADFRGVPSPLAVSLDASWREPASGEGDGHRAAPGPMLIAEFSDPELAQAEAKYQNFFHLATLPEGRIRRHCKLPFFLRLASEIYGGRSERLPFDISEDELVEAWLERKFRAMTNPGRARLELRATATAVYERATRLRPDQQSFSSLEAIPESDLLLSPAKYYDTFCGCRASYVWATPKV